MIHRVLCLSMACLWLPLALSAQTTLSLQATLSPPNQTGTNPEYREDALGVVPSSASGHFSATLDVTGNELRDIVLEVAGMSVADLKNFGPNGTPFHLHLPNSGRKGDFGFNVVDLMFDAPEGSLVDTDEGFRFTRPSMSILVAAQGKYGKAGVHPGDDVIAQRLVEGHAFVLVHSSKPIFTNADGKFPDGRPTPKGFPFGELRGEVIVSR